MQTAKPYLLFVFKAMMVISFIIGSYFLLSIPGNSGDEAGFATDLELVKTAGWFHAIADRISIPYMLLAYPFSFFMPNYLALRLVNVLLFLLLVLYFAKWGGIKNRMFYFYFLFYSSTGWFSAGINDVLFTVALVVFFNETYKAIEGKPGFRINLMWCALLVVIFTRELFYVYVPVILFSVFLLWKKGMPLFHKSWAPLVLLAFFTLVNIPSLQKNHSLSYDHKAPPDGVKSTWAQRQYLAQLLVNEGKLANYQHPSWEETDAYLLKNGSGSLPVSVLDGMLFDYKLTTIEFFKDFADIIKSSIRQMGLIMVLLLMYVAWQVFRRKFSYNLYLPAVNLVVIGLFALIIISYVETRWLVAPFIAAILYYSDFEADGKIHPRWIYCNYMVTTVISFYGIYKMFLNFY